MVFSPFSLKRALFFIVWGSRVPKIGHTGPFWGPSRVRFLVGRHTPSLVGHASLLEREVISPWVKVVGQSSARVLYAAGLRQSSGPRRSPGPCPFAAAEYASARLVARLAPPQRALAHRSGGSTTGSYQWCYHWVGVTTHPPPALTAGYRPGSRLPSRLTYAWNSIKQ